MYNPFFPRFFSQKTRIWLFLCYGLQKAGQLYGSIEVKWLFEAVECIEVTTIGLNVRVGDNITHCQHTFSVFILSLDLHRWMQYVRSVRNVALTPTVRRWISFCASGLKCKVDRPTTKCLRRSGEHRVRALYFSGFVCFMLSLVIAVNKY